ncbi:MAG: zinc dependent phospholipase C family protein [Promethearchaeati archaeon SRVP18_Atabeyarchaeia-1]
MNNGKPKIRLLSILLILLIAYGATGSFQTVAAWSDGGQSIDSNHIQYGTHDWIAEHALHLLPSNESGWLTSNRNIFLLGTEAPEYGNVSFKGRNGYGDIENHHNYYSGRFPRDCFDDSAAVRAEQEFQKALLCLRNSSYDLAAWYAGAMTHYISDVGSWPHVISNATPSHASKYEEQLNLITDDYSKNPEFLLSWAWMLNSFNTTLSVSVETAYSVSLMQGLEVYCDGGGYHPCGPHPAATMDAQFQDSWSSVDDWPLIYQARVGYSMTDTIMSVAYALHSLTVEAELTGASGGSTPSQLPTLTFAIVFIAVFGVMAVVAAFAYSERRRPR